MLEFELRKARQTIFNLREELTQQTLTVKGVSSNAKADPDQEPNPDSNEDDFEEEEDSEIKAHEQRILNFLINEYLLQHGYKITAITFSDENNDAEYFEDWDSIGINVVKPPNLLKLYKDFGKHFDKKKDPVACLDVATETESDQEMLELRQELKSQLEKCSTLSGIVEGLDLNLEELRNGNAQLQTQLQEKQTVIDILKSSRTIGNNEVCSSPMIEDNLDSKAALPSILDPDLILELADSLPKIVPHMLLNKREELLPLLLIAIQKHPNR